MTEFDLGARLRQIREDRGMSQRELADAAGVTNGAISLIERNMTSPSVSSLKRVLSVFSMSLSDFFAQDEPEADDFVFRADSMKEINPARVYENGTFDGLSGLSLKRVGHRKADSTLLMLFECYQPGADTGDEAYSHEGEEAGIVIEGELLLTVGSRSEVLKAGDGYQFSSTTPHRFRNIGKIPCIVVSACTPPSF